jgi:hypothetical protein
MEGVAEGLVLALNKRPALALGMRLEPLRDDIMDLMHIAANDADALSDAV